MRDRLQILQVANPSNFPSTKYRRGSGRALEQETDCSHFVHEIYRRAGFSYAFRSTDDLQEAPEFELLPEEEAMPGDLMLFRGHVGLVDNDGRIISSTYRRGRRPSSITRFQRTVFKPLRSHMTVMRYRCRPEGGPVVQEASNPPAPGPKKAAKRKHRKRS
jgi:cell wall-associated NlpC family hydrolase